MIQKRDLGILAGSSGICAYYDLKPLQMPRQKWLQGRACSQLGEHLLCKHAVISPKSLNRRLFIVQNPLQIGLLIGLQTMPVFCPSLGRHSENDSIRASTTSK